MDKRLMSSSPDLQTDNVPSMPSAPKPKASVQAAVRICQPLGGRHRAMLLSTVREIEWRSSLRRKVAEAGSLRHGKIGQLCRRLRLTLSRALAPSPAGLYDLNLHFPYARIPVRVEEAPLADVLGER